MQIYPEYDPENNNLHYNGYHIEVKENGEENDKFVVQINSEVASFPEFENLEKACQYIDLLNFRPEMVH